MTTEERLKALEEECLFLREQVHKLALLLSDTAAITNRDLNEIRAKVGIPLQDED